MTKNKNLLLNHNLSCATYAIYLAIHTFKCKESKKIGKVTRRGPTSRESKIRNRELKTRLLSVSEYLIVVFKMLYYSLLL